METLSIFWAPRPLTPVFWTSDTTVSRCGHRGLAHVVLLNPSVLQRPHERLRGSMKRGGAELAEADGRWVECPPTPRHPYLASLLLIFGHRALDQWPPPGPRPGAPTGAGHVLLHHIPSMHQQRADMETVPLAQISGFINRGLFLGYSRCPQCGLNEPVTMTSSLRGGEACLPFWTRSQNQTRTA